MTIDIDNDSSSLTRIHVTSRDTSFFLYALSTAFSFNDLLINQVHIDTIQYQVVDDFFLSDKDGKKITDRTLIDRVRFSILLTKQFTFFLSNSPHPHIALLRFESMIRDIVVQKDRTHWSEFLQNPSILREIAMVLGTSDFLWEDFIRGQYESFFSMLSREGRQPIREESTASLQEKLNRGLVSRQDKESKIAFLNEFKNNEIFRIDLLHILEPRLGFAHLSHNLT